MKSGFLRSSKIITALLTAWVMSMVLPGCAVAGNEAKINSKHAIARLSSATVANGQVTVIEVDLRHEDPSPAGLKARFEQNEIALFQHPVKAQGIYCGLVGIPIGKKPQETIINLQWTDAAGRQQSTRVALRIIEGSYKKEALKVAPKHVKPSPGDLKRIRAEKTKIRRIYASSNHSRLWYGNFIKPLTGNTTSVFGNQRLFNGELKSYHRGTDLRAKTGTPVYASNSGIVRLAQNLFYSGNIVIVDHGNGIFTNYAHLSKIQVRTGQHIARGDQIGLSGATGRVSGPHLHWGVKINGAYVDPMQFIGVISDLLVQ
jgi:murein DD-endopeptidase MepM/ murein hydrolase activator NlpD